MTDEELIKELRKGDHCGSTYDVDKDDAADRIEQLLKDAEVANDAINHWIVAYNNMEANLAKAVEVLRNTEEHLSAISGIWFDCSPRKEIRALLEELENYNG